MIRLKQSKGSRIREPLMTSRKTLQTTMKPSQLGQHSNYNLRSTPYLANCMVGYADFAQWRNETVLQGHRACH